MSKQKKRIFPAFLRKEIVWLICVFFILAIFAGARTYSTSYIAKIADLLQAGGSIPLLLQLAFLGFGIAAFSYFMRYAGSVLCIRLTEKLALETRCRLVEHLQKIPYLKYEQMETGQLQSVLRNDVQQGSDLIYTIFSRILLNVQLFVATFVYMLMISPGVALVVSALTLLMAFLNHRILIRQKRYQTLSRDAAGEVSETVLSICKGMSTVKAYSAKDFVLSILKASKDDYNRNTYRVSQIDVGRLTLYNLANNLTLYLTIFYFGYQGIRGEAVISDTLVFIVLLRQMMMPAEVIFRWMSTAIVGLAAWDRIYKVLEVPAEMRTEKTIPRPAKEACAKEISFGYEPDKLTLDRLSMTFRIGELTALKGRSGSGKTTLCKVLSGLYPEAEVEWRIDGTDGYMGSLGDWVTYSPADTQVFSMSIYENLVFDQTGISRDVCMSMADELGVGDWIRSLPQGIDTPIASGGRTLSGGQRQMIMNMRALLSERPVLILDEAFSALDEVRCGRLMEYLKKSKADRAVLLITHQERWAEECDGVICL